jgi:hypothetical protein
MSFAGQKAQRRTDTLRFHLDCLTPAARSILAARYLRKSPPWDRRFLLHISIAQLAFFEVFSGATYN